MPQFFQHGQAVLKLVQRQVFICLMRLLDGAGAAYNHICSQCLEDTRLSAKRNQICAIGPS